MPRDSSARFDAYVGIDYAGAGTPEARLPGLQVYTATPARGAMAVGPAGRSAYWSRRDLAAWLSDLLADRHAAGEAVLVGIDHGFAFPLAYARAHGLATGRRPWDAFLDDFAAHWPTDATGVTVEDVRRGRTGRGTARGGSAKWRREAEVLAGAKSVFHFDVPGSVAKSTHAGLPWLLALRRRFRRRLHVWPFDGWSPPAGVSVLAEAYPALYRPQFPARGLTSDQHDAYAVAAWMRREDATGRLADHFTPALPAKVRNAARFEGWILGVGAERIPRR